MIDINLTRKYLAANLNILFQIAKNLFNFFYYPLFWQVKHLQIMQLTAINMKPQSCSHRLPTLDSSGPWINVNEPEVGISHNFQDMRMPTDENIRLILHNQGS